MKKNRRLLTREHYVCDDGLPFDCTPSGDALRPGYVRLATSGPEAWGVSSIRHDAFDAYMDAPPEKRARQDRVGDAVFDRMEKVLDDAPREQLKSHANRFLLHAADPYSRTKAKAVGVTLNDFEACHRAIVSVANKLAALICGSQIGALPVPRFDPTEGLDTPFFPGESLDSLLSEWKTENDERETWQHDLS